MNSAPMHSSPIILGLCYGVGDTSACLMVNGEIVAACEQERFSLVKHSEQFPTNAINECLKIGGVGIHEIERVAYVFNPYLKIRETYFKTALQDEKRIGVLIRDIERIKKWHSMEETIRRKTNFKGKIDFHFHHLCHVAGAFYESGFETALLAAYDGIGEINTSMLALGTREDIKVLQQENRYPDSLGIIYNGITFYLGWKVNCDEGIIMGLAPFGDPTAIIPGSKRTYYSIFEEMIQETGKYTYRVNPDWISYYEVRDKWFSDKFYDLLGPKRDYKDTVTDHHRNIAAALQKRLEVVVCNQLQFAQTEYGVRRLALSGGICLNCSMNGKIASLGIFDEIYVQPASGDAGTVIGACVLSHKNITGELKSVKDFHPYLGSRFTDLEIEDSFKAKKCFFTKSEDIEVLTAQKLAEGKIVGWFQGASEFGPRALGNRSILVKPYPESMKDYLNEKVKFRESFRPFAPSVLKEHSSTYFELSQESKYMLIAAKVVPQMKEKIPAVVHVNDTCRVQTVKSSDNQKFRKLLEAFYKITGCPVLLNTSFNVKGQPIVNNPKQAIECYEGTNIDFLVIGNYYAEE